MLVLLIAAGAVWVTRTGDTGNLEEQIVEGRALYRNVCAPCHGAEGAFGPPLTHDILEQYRSASILYDYVSVAMPYDSMGSLSERDYWMVLAYLLDSQDLLDPRVGLSTTTADRVRFDAR